METDQFIEQEVKNKIQELFDSETLKKWVLTEKKAETLYQLLQNATMFDKWEIDFQNEKISIENYLKIIRDRLEDGNTLFAASSLFSLVLSFGKRMELFRINLEDVFLSLLLIKDEQQEFINHLETLMAKVLKESFTYEKIINNQQDMISFIQASSKKLNHTAEIISIETDSILGFIEIKVEDIKQMFDKLNDSIDKEQDYNLIKDIIKKEIDNTKKIIDIKLLQLNITINDDHTLKQLSKKVRADTNDKKENETEETEEETEKKFNKEETEEYNPEETEPKKTLHSQKQKKRK